MHSRNGVLGQPIYSDDCGVSTNLKPLPLFYMCCECAQDAPLALCPFKGYSFFKTHFTERPSATDPKHLSPSFTIQFPSKSGTEDILPILVLLPSTPSHGTQRPMGATMYPVNSKSPASTTTNYSVSCYEQPAKNMLKQEKCHSPP